VPFKLTPGPVVVVTNYHPGLEAPPDDPGCYTMGDVTEEVTTRCRYVGACGQVHLFPGYGFAFFLDPVTRRTYAQAQPPRRP